jgi:hypothetical protein
MPTTASDDALALFAGKREQESGSRRGHRIVWSIVGKEHTINLEVQETLPAACTKPIYIDHETTRSRPI